MSGSGVSGVSGVSQWPMGISGQLDAEGSGWPQGSQGSPGVSQCLGLRSQVAVGSYSGPRISWQLDAGVSGWPWRSQIGARCLSVQIPGVSWQPWGLTVSGSGGTREPQGLRVLQVSYSGPGNSGQLDTEVLMRLQGSQGSPGVSQCLGLESQGGSGVSRWLLESYSGPGIHRAVGLWGLNAALGSRSVWVWGLRWPWGLTVALGFHGSWMLESHGGPGGLRSPPGVSVCSPWGLKAALGSHSAWVWELRRAPGS